MECKVGKPIASVEHEIFSLDSEFTFLQAVRILLRYAPVKALPGQRGPFSDEGVLFRANASLAFPRSDISLISNLPNSNKDMPDCEMITNFMGLYGPSSPLPAYFTEDILFSDNEDSNVRHFLDIFNHRMISFFYRALEKYKYSVRFNAHQTDDYTDKLLSFIGVQQKVVRETSVIRWNRLIPFVSLLGQKIRSAWVLERIIKSYFNVEKAEISQYIMTKVAIQNDDHNSLGMGNASLGLDLTIGRTVSDRSGKIRIKIGPLKYSEFRHFLPYGKFNREFYELVRFVLNDPLDVELELVLSSIDIPPIALTKAKIFQVGLNSWLGKPGSEQYTIRI